MKWQPLPWSLAYTSGEELDNYKKWQASRCLTSVADLSLETRWFYIFFPNQPLHLSCYVEHCTGTGCTTLHSSLPQGYNNKLICHHNEIVKKDKCRGWSPHVCLAPAGPGDPKARDCHHHVVWWVKSSALQTGFRPGLSAPASPVT